MDHLWLNMKRARLLVCGLVATPPSLLEADSVAGWHRLRVPTPLVATGTPPLGKSARQLLMRLCGKDLSKSWFGLLLQADGVLWSFAYSAHHVGAALHILVASCSIILFFVQLMRPKHQSIPQNVAGRLYIIK